MANEDLESLAETASLELGGLGRALHKAVRLEWIRIKTKAVDAALGAAFLVVAIGFGLGAVATAASFLALALRNAIGNVGAGAAILAFMLFAGLAARMWIRRKGVRQAQEALEDES